MTVTYKHKFNKKYGYDKQTSHSVQDIAKITGYRLSGLKTIYNKGMGAYYTNPTSVRRSVTSSHQWAMARVYSAIMGGKESKIGIDGSHLQKR